MNRGERRSRGDGSYGGVVLSDLDGRRKEAISRAVERHLSLVLDRTRRICEVPAPTFAEERRAAFVRDEFVAQGIEPWTDEVGNVYARRQGSGQGVLLLAAHLDTVFPVETALVVRQ